MRAVLFAFVLVLIGSERLPAMEVLTNSEMLGLKAEWFSNCGASQPCTTPHNKCFCRGGAISNHCQGSNGPTWRCLGAVNYLVCEGSFDWTDGCKANAGGTVDCGQKQIAQCVNRPCDGWFEGFGTACEFDPNSWTNVPGEMCLIRNCNNVKP